MAGNFGGSQCLLVINTGLEAGLGGPNDGTLGAAATRRLGNPAIHCPLQCSGYEAAFLVAGVKREQMRQA